MVKVTYNNPGNWVIGKILITAGESNLQDSDWKQIEKHTSVLAAISHGELEVSIVKDSPKEKNLNELPEGNVKKGGVNIKPTVPRPQSPPKRGK